MGHQETPENIGHAEKKFNELMCNGDDFLKIEIYRNAVKQYKLAATLDIDNDLANRKIAECERLLSNEQKWIYILLSIAAVTVIIIWLI
jgi:hypothetical protein